MILHTKIVYIHRSRVEIYLVIQRTLKRIVFNSNQKLKLLKCLHLWLYYLYFHGFHSMLYSPSWNSVRIYCCLYYFPFHKCASIQQPQKAINIKLNGCKLILCVLGGPLDPKMEEFLNIFTPIAQWLGSANSCINPILYAFNEKYRRGFIAIIRSRKCWGRLRYEDLHLTMVIYCIYW